MMLFKRYTSLLISTSIFVQSVSPAFSADHDSVEKIEQNLSTLKKFSSTPAPLNFASDSEKTAAGVLHWAEKNGEVYILLGKRNDSKDQDVGEWCNAGGKSDAVDEDLINTSDREVREELNGIYAHHPRLLRKQPFTALYSPDEHNGLLHYMYWQQVQYLDPEIFNKKANEATEGHSKEYTDFMWVKARDLLYTVVTQAPVMTVGDKTIEIFAPLFSTLSTDAGTTFLHELTTHTKIRRFNKDVRPLCNRLYIEKDQNEPTTETIPGEGISVHWDLPKIHGKPQPTHEEAIPFGQNGFGKWHTKRQLIGPDGEILSETPVFFDQKKEEDIFAEAVAAHGMAMVELKRRRPTAQAKEDGGFSKSDLQEVLGSNYKTSKDFRESKIKEYPQKTPELRADLANITAMIKLKRDIDNSSANDSKQQNTSAAIPDVPQWNPNCDETLSRIHLRIVLGPDYKTPADFMTQPNSRRAADLANIKAYFKIDDEAEVEQKGNEFKREIKLLDSDYEFFADIFEWEDENKQWPTFYHGASSNLNNLFKAFTYLRELMDVRSFKNLMALRGTDIYFKKDKTVWDMLNRTGDHENSETSQAMLFLNFVLLAGLKTTRTTSSSAEYVLNDHSVIEQNIRERFKEAMALAGWNESEWDYYASLNEQFIAHKNPEAGNSVMLAISQNPKDLDNYNYPTIGGHFYDPARYNVEEPPESSAASAKEPSESSDSEGEKPSKSLAISADESSESSDREEEKQTKDTQPIKSTLQIIKGIQDEFERQQKDGIEPFTTNTEDKKSLVPENRLFLHPSRVMDPDQTRIKAFDRFPLSPMEEQAYDREMRRTTIATMADWLAQKTTVMEGSFVNEPTLKKLYKAAHRGMTHEEVIESPSHDGFLYLVRAGHLESVKRYLASYPEILKLIDQTALANAALEGRNIEQIDYFLNEVFQGDWKVFLRDNFKNNLGQTPLHLAVEAKHIGLLQTFLESGLIDPNIQNDEGFTPLSLVPFLMCDSSSSDKDVAKKIVELLLADYRVDPFDIMSVFCNFEENEVKEVIELLLSHKKFDINAVDKQGNTLLSNALSFGQQEVAKFICSHPTFDPNIQDSLGQTPLSVAIAPGHEDILAILLADDRVDPNAVDNYGQAPLFVAIQQQNKDIVQLLLADDRTDPNAVDNSGQTPLFVAIQKQNKDMVQLLLANDKTEPNLPDGYGQIPLFVATQQQNKDTVQLLLADDRVDPNIPDSFGQRPLSVAVLKGHEDMLPILLANDKVDPNYSGNNGETLLIKAIHNNKDVIKLLLSYDKVDPNTKNSYGNTPLLEAIAHKQQEIVQLLLANDRTDPNIPNNYGEIPLCLAIQNQDKGMVQLLLANDKTEPNLPDGYGQIPLFVAIQQQDKDMVQLLLANDRTDPNISSNRHTPLSWAMLFDQHDIVKILLGSGKVNPNIITAFGTPLSWAITFDYQDIIQLLLSHPHIDLNIKHLNGDSALHLAVKRNAIDMVRTLLAKGANVNTYDSIGHTPLDLARNSGLNEIVELLHAVHLKQAGSEERK